MSSTEGAPAAQVRHMFGRIAPTYDLLNRLLSAGRDRAWRRSVAECLATAASAPAAGSRTAVPRRVLDLCAGTGDLALEIARTHPGAAVVAGDFCQEMLERGTAKGLRRRAAPVVCDALRLCFESERFDALTVAFGVRNFESLERGLAEIRRVLRPGGTLAVLEFFRSDSGWRALPFRFYFGQVLPRVGRLVSRDAEAYAYLPRSVGDFVTRADFVALLAQHGFHDVRRRELSGGIATLFVACRG